jgi:general secretion pathway protein G
MRRSLPLRQQARQRGFSKFEFALAAALFAVLVGVAANRLVAYQETLETVAAEQLITNLRGALALRMSQLTAAERRREIDAIADENPIGWLYEKPKNYLGEYYAPDNQKLAPGNWYFDRRDKTLVYLLIRRKSFAPHASILLKFKVESLRLPLIPPNPVQSAVIANVALVQVIEPTGVGGQ